MGIRWLTCILHYIYLINMEKNILKKILVGVGLSTSLVVVGVGVVYNIYKDNNYQIARAVEYDDNRYEIILSADDLNNYTYNGYYELYSVDALGSNASYEYNGDTYIYDTFNESYVWLVHSTDILKISSDGVWYLNDVSGDFEYELIITVDSFYYDYVKEVVENSFAEPMNVSIFDALTESLGGFITTLSSGITVMITMFYADGALTTLGILATLVVAVGLCYFLFRLLLGLIRLRG